MLKYGGVLAFLMGGFVGIGMVASLLRPDQAPVEYSIKEPVTDIQVRPMRFAKAIEVVPAKPQASSSTPEATEDKPKRRKKRRTRKPAAETVKTEEASISSLVSKGLAGDNAASPE